MGQTLERETPHRLQARGRALGIGVAWLALASALAGCANEARRPVGWSEVTHGSSASPDYSLLFNADVVHSLEIAIQPGDYAAMQSNLEGLLGDRTLGGGGQGGPPNGGNFGGAVSGRADAGLPDGPGRAGGFAPPGDGQLPPFGADAGAGLNPGGGGGAVSLLAEDPMYVPVEVRHDGHVWTQVGMRYKGNSSLAASGGTGKLPFRLDFDEYEDRYPAVDNQRFYGFDELTFASNWSDDSQLRECFATELLRDRGIP
ncbi:MAG: hypothetical protein RL685_6332, partial [Pseudomonadota bacterium]